jgi:uncharacterized membrane protein YqhA
VERFRPAIMRKVARFSPSHCLERNLCRLCPSTAEDFGSHGTNLSMKVLNSFFLLSRWIILVPVLSLLVGCGYFAWLTVLEVYHGITASSTTYGLLSVIQAMDTGLLCAVLFLFSLGLFELFIGDLDVPENHPFRRALVIDSLDDLKGKLATVIVMLLIVKFFEKVQTLEPKNYYDLLALAGGVALLGAGIWLTKK